MRMLRDDARPLYVRASERLRRFITEHELSDGDRLPPEAELAVLLGVSRSTIREALRDLELRGLVERAHGRGTTVRTPRVVTGLNRLESLEAVAEAQGWVCGTLDTEIVERPLPETVAAELEVTPVAPGVRLSRIKTRDGTAICEMVTWLPATVISAAALRSSFGSSITELFVAAGERRLEYARASVSAVSASEEEAAKLGTTPGAPLVALFETFLDADDSPICWSRNVFVPDAISLEVTRHPVVP